MKLHLSDELFLPLDWMSLATVVYGARGSGKTTLGRVCAEEVTKANQRFCAIDLKGDWYGLKSSADGRDEGLPVVVFGGDHKDLPLEEGAGVFIAETIASLGQSTIIDLEEFSKGKQLKFLAAFFERLYDKNRDPLLLLLDEAQRYAPQKPIDPEAAKCLGAIEDLVKLGRKHGIGPVLFSQRGSGLNKEVSELCDLMVAFRTPGPLDQDRVENWLDANTTAVQKKSVMGLLSGLQTGTAVFASGHPDLKVFGVYPVRRPDTFDSSATPKIGKRRQEPKRLAKPDLDALHVAMKDAVERAEAADPSKLRQKLALVTKELETLKSQPSPAKDRGSREKPILTEADRALLAKLADGLGNIKAFLLSAGANLYVEAEEHARHAYARALEVHAEDVAKMRVEFERRLESKGFQKILGKLASVTSVTAVSAVQKAITPQDFGRRFEAAGRADRPSVVTTTDPDGDEVRLNRLAERKILQVLAQHDHRSVRQVAIQTAYAQHGGGFRAALGKLRKVGYIVSNGSGLAITNTGRQAIGEVDPLPTGAALVAHWMQQFNRLAEREVLRVVIAAYPRSVSPATIAANTNPPYEPEGGGFRAALGKLRTLGLIEGRGDLRASEDLFS